MAERWKIWVENWPTILSRGAFPRGSIINGSRSLACNFCPRDTRVIKFTCIVRKEKKERKNGGEKRKRNTKHENSDLIMTERHVNQQDLFN